MNEDTTFGNNLAKYWSEFVNCPKRLLTEGPFLIETFNRYSNPRILDAATGTGCDDIFISQMGYDITSNEIDEGLRNEAIYNAQLSDITLKILTVDWREFRSSFPKHHFDIVLLLGNSLCLLEDKPTIIHCLTEIKSIIKKGGCLIVDERNFPYILKDKSSILKGNFNYSSSYLYCGSSIIGRPIKIEKDIVRFGYFHTNEGLLGTLNMYPFSKGELQSILSEVGFNTIEQYSDFDRGYNKSADFFTYVAKKHKS